MSESRTPAETAIEMNQLVLPVHTNSYGTAFGGTIMGWIDICAAMAAQRHARRVVVTASMDQIDFVAPIKNGQLVNLKSIVNYVHDGMPVTAFLLAEKLLRLTGLRAQRAIVLTAFDHPGDRRFDALKNIDAQIAALEAEQ